MTIDIAATIDAVTRELATREVQGASARVLAASRRFTAARSEIWDALTSAARIPRWFLPITGDLRPGGRYQLTGNAGGEILVCDPPSRWEVTWEMPGQVSWLTVALSDAAEGGTLLRLEHTAQVPTEFWELYGPGAVGVGWDQALLGLQEHFVTPVAVTPETATAWLASAEGRAFVMRSSERWCDASIAAGTDPEMARAAAARTTAFYTGG